MVIKEGETILLMNEADYRDGFITFSTTNIKYFKRLVKRIGMSNVIAVKEDRGLRGEVRNWLVKVNAKVWSKANFGIKNVCKRRGSDIKRARAALTVR